MMHMAKCVTEKYEAAKSALTEMLKEPTHIALSTNIWTVLQPKCTLQLLLILFHQIGN